MLLPSHDGAQWDSLDVVCQSQHHRLHRSLFLHWPTRSYKNQIAVSLWTIQYSTTRSFFFPFVWHYEWYLYRVGQIKWHHFTFLLVTNERINKILWFLAQINYIKQQIAWCQFYVNEWVTRYGAPRVTSRVRLIQAANFQEKSYGDLDQ